VNAAEHIRKAEQHLDRADQPDLLTPAGQNAAAMLAFGHAMMAATMTFRGMMGFLETEDPEHSEDGEDDEHGSG
jgi:hypothetical protein